MSASLVGSEMCIRDSLLAAWSMTRIWSGSCPTMIARVGDFLRAFAKSCISRAMPRGKPTLGSADSGKPFFDAVPMMSLQPHRTTHGGMPKPRIL
eukprot:12210054-Alexandrium_andersonii.AAC.1